MWRIRFQQFRCWENLLIEAPVGGVTLIKGSSGIGKTTILQGITWCLYGNIRLVAPNHLEKAKTRVTIEFPYTLNNIPGILMIDRQKNPNRLLVTHVLQGQPGTTYEDKVGQALIDDLFGTHDIWLASCYIGQGCRNSFLTAPNTGKMELLNSIAFHEEDPTTFIERIDGVITETDIDYKAKLTVLTQNITTLQTMLAGVDTGKALSNEQVAELTRMIAVLDREQKRLQAEKTQREINSGMLEQLRRQLIQAQTTTVTAPIPNLALDGLLVKFGGICGTRDDVDVTMAQTTEWIALLQKRDTLEAEVKQFASLLLPYVNLDKTVQYTPADLQEAMTKEIAFRESQKLAQSLGVLYSEPVIKETIQRHQNTLAGQERLRLEQERGQLRDRINMMEMEQLQQATPLQFPDLTPQQIPIPDYTRYSTADHSVKIADWSKQQGALQSHIQHLQRGRDVLQCPQCKGSLRYQQGTLILAETAPSDLAELKMTQQQLEQVTAAIVKAQKEVQMLSMGETNARAEYERTVAFEQRRVEGLREKARQLELEKQRRELAGQSRAKQLLDLKADLSQRDAVLAVTPRLPGVDRLLSKGEVDQLHVLIGRLSSITIVSPPTVSSQAIQSYLKYQDLARQQAASVTKHQDYLVTLPALVAGESVRTLQTYIDKLREYEATIRHVNDERVRLERLCISLREQIIALEGRVGPDPTPDINRVATEIRAHQDAIRLSTEANNAIQYHARVIQEREQIVELNTTLGDLQTMRQFAVEAECRILQQVVDSINGSIQGVCSTLFDRDISIALSLFKTTKTTGNVKPVVNFSIAYQGGTYDNINQMSGGEGDRASLALTLAMNRLSSCPLLMLDESLASLDLNMKEAAIRTIRENTNNTVLVIVHDGIEGIFDGIIDCDGLRGGRY
jgi:DNA repair exonuclease SbcCD ATPase subunit